MCAKQLPDTLPEQIGWCQSILGCGMGWAGADLVNISAAVTILCIFGQK